MSFHFDVFIKCDFKVDTPERVIDFVRYITTPDAPFKELPDTEDEGLKNLWSEVSGQFLLTNPELEIFTDFRRVLRHYKPAIQGGEPVYKYTLTHFAHDVLDDGFYEEQYHF